MKTHSLLICSLLVLLLIGNKKGMAEVVDPHVLSTERYNETCGKCHPNDPHDPNKLFTLSETLNEVCESCHQQIRMSCKKAITKEVANILLEQIPNLILSTRNESLNCDSCHLVHEEGGKGIKHSYILFLKQVERINPHWAGIFCFYCHDEEPKVEEDPLNLKFNGDRVAICIQCHNNRRARADNHPVNIRPSEGKGVKLDERFPLNDGKVTCVTCHDIRARCEWVGSRPKFLRGGPYENRVDACLECHQKDSYRAVNPHEQIDEHGRLRKDRCTYCHILDIGFTPKE